MMDDHIKHFTEKRVDSSDAELSNYIKLHYSLKISCIFGVVELK